jgi:hypothetical protein
VRLVSLTDHTPGQREYADLEVFKRNSVSKGCVREAEFDAWVTPLIERAERYSPGNRRAIAGLAAERGITLAAHDDATVEHVAERHPRAARPRTQSPYVCARPTRWRGLVGRCSPTALRTWPWRIRAGRSCGRQRHSPA